MLCRGEDAEEGDDGLVISGCDAPELLEFVEHALDPVSVLVSTEAAGDNLFAVRLWRDDRQYPLEQQAGANIVAIVALVGRHELGRGNWQGDQVIYGFVVGGLAAGEDEATRASLTVCAGMDFARKAAAASTKALLISPHLAPAA